MLQGYFDDSGSDLKSFAFVVAGYILPAKQMEEFADDWAATLRQEPKIEYFKMSEAFSGGGAFGNLAVEFRKAKVRDLLGVINMTCLR